MHGVYSQTTWRNIIAAIGMIAIGSGCAKLSPKTPRVDFVGTETIRKFEAELFLECVEPESEEMLERKLQRSSMDRPLYYSDKANRDQPANLHIPTIHTMTIQAFRSVAHQGRGTPPRLVLQLRERTKVLKAKVYQVQTPMYDARDEFVRKEVRAERFPRYYDWNWFPDCEVRGERPIRFRIRQMEEQVGFCHSGIGHLDEHGMINFDLQPYLTLGASSEQGLHFVFTCEHEALHAEIRVPAEVFQSYVGHE